MALTILPINLRTDDPSRLRAELSRYTTEASNAISSLASQVHVLQVRTPPLWTAPVLVGDWSNFGGDWEPAGYRIDQLGVVHLRGLVKDGDPNVTIFTLPEGLRPAAGIHLPTVAGGNTFGALQVAATGEVLHASGDNAWFSLRASFEAVSPAMPAGPWPQDIRNRLGRQPTSVYVGKACTTSGAAVGPCSVRWSMGPKNTVRIEFISGLPPEQTCEVTLVMV